MSVTVADSWVTIFKPNPRAAMRLFCFPYAGGAATIYRRWPERLPAEVELCAVLLPGRGSRLNEPPLRRLSDLVEAVDRALEPLHDRPVAYFGHSMGAMIAYELAHRVRRERGVEPARLLVSGRRAPHLPDPNPPTHLLPHDEFVGELRRLNGTPPQVLEHPELMELMIPILRADFEVCETYEFSIRRPLACPMTVLGGTADEDASVEELAGWREHTTGPCAVRVLAGDHFFLHTAEASIVASVGEDLRAARR